MKLCIVASVHDLLSIATFDLPLVLAPFAEEDIDSQLRLDCVGLYGYVKVPMYFNPIALTMAKTLWSFGRSECNRVKTWSSFVK